MSNRKQNNKNNDPLQFMKINSLNDLMKVGSFECFYEQLQQQQMGIQPNNQNNQQQETIFWARAKGTPIQQQQHQQALEKQSDPMSVEEQKKKIKANIDKEINNLWSEIGQCVESLSFLKKKLPNPENKPEAVVVRTQKFSLPVEILTKNAIKASSVRREEMKLTKSMFSSGLKSLRESMQTHDNSIEEQLKFKQSFKIMPRSQLSALKIFPYESNPQQMYVSFFNHSLFSDPHIPPPDVSPHLLFIPLQVSKNQQPFLFSKKQNKRTTDFFSTKIEELL